jgi:hypothetical protein
VGQGGAQGWEKRKNAQQKEKQWEVELLVKGRKQLEFVP